MARFSRRGHWRRGRNGNYHWVSSHNVRRDDFSRMGSGDYRHLLGAAHLKTAPTHSPKPRQKLKATGDIQWSRISSTPNAECPVCGADVWFIRNKNGGCAYFDELGKPWPLHPCMSRDRSSADRMVEAEVNGYDWADGRPVRRSQQSAATRPALPTNSQTMASSTSPSSGGPNHSAAAGNRPDSDSMDNVSFALLALIALAISIPVSFWAFDYFAFLPVWLPVWFIAVPTVVSAVVLVRFLVVNNMATTDAWPDEMGTGLAGAIAAIISSLFLLAAAIVFNVITLGFGLPVMTIATWGRPRMKSETAAD